MRNYYFIKNGAQSGPHTLDQLQYHGILPETMVWYDGLPEWMEAKAVPELSELFVVPVSMAVPPPIKSEGTDWRTIFWRIAAGATFILMIVVAVWKLNGGSFDDFFHPKPDPEPIGPVDPPNPKPDVVPTIDQVEAQKAEYRENWSNYVKAFPSGAADTGAFGGFSGVKIMVKNDMKYTIDRVAVVVEYSLKNGQKIISKEHYVSYVGPKGFSENIEFEPINRGISYEAKIVGVVCEEIGLDYYYKD